VVTRGGGAVVEEWTLTISQAEGTQGAGSATYNRGPCAAGDIPGNAGTLDFSFVIAPKLQLSRVSGGGPCVVSLTNLSTGAITPNIGVTGSGPYFDGDTSSLSLLTNPEGFGFPPFDAIYGTAATYDADDNSLFTEFAAWPTTETKLGVVTAGCAPGVALGGVSYVGDVQDGTGSTLTANLGACFSGCTADCDGDGDCDDTDPCPCDIDNDKDGDGLCADVDDCDNSDTSGTVEVAGCQTGVTNQFGGICGDGCSLQDCINNCGVGVTNHGQYVSCVAHLTNDLKAQGIITGRDKGRIQRCAAKAKPHPAGFIRIVGERG